jgi:hypothetical protein
MNAERLNSQAVNGRWSGGDFSPTTVMVAPVGAISTTSDNVRTGLIILCRGFDLLLASSRANHTWLIGAAWRDFIFWRRGFEVR